MRLFPALILTACASGGGGGGEGPTPHPQDSDLPDPLETDTVPHTGASTGDTSLPPSACDLLQEQGWGLISELELVARKVEIEVSTTPYGGATWYAPEHPHMFATPDPDGGTVLAWAASGGGVHITRVDDDGVIAGDVTVAGTEVHGLAVTPEGVAVLVHRAPDALHLVVVDDAGAELNDTVALSGSYWWQSTWWMGDGRLLWTGSDLVAYVHTSHNGHEGDALMYFTAGGAQKSGGWSWGCSHSLDQRLAWDGSTLAPVCLSDCYPGQGVWFNNRTEVSAEPGGNCAGELDAELGGLVAADSGFWLTIASSAGVNGRDIRLFRLDDRGATLGEAALTDTPGVVERAGGLAPFGAGLLAGWTAGNTSVLTRLDDSGQVTHAEQAIPARLSDHGDLFAYPDGRVGWAYATRGSRVLTLVQVVDCAGP